jgi:sugar phosphate permease
MALAYIPATMAGMSGVRPEQTGLASGLISTTYQIGSAIGLAAMVAVAAGSGSDLLAGFQAAFFGALIVAAVAALAALLFIRGTPAMQAAAAE